MNIKACVLDAGLEREPSKIKNHLLEVKINVIKRKNIGKLPLYTYLVPHPVKDLLGMGPAVDILLRSLDPGSLSSFAQFDTFRSYWSDFSTVCKVSIKGVL